MIIHTILLVLYLSDLNAFVGAICGRKKSADFDIDSFNYVGDPVTVVCVTEKK